MDLRVTIRKGQAPGAMMVRAGHILVEFVLIRVERGGTGHVCHVVSPIDGVFPFINENKYLIWRPSLTVDFRKLGVDSVRVGPRYTTLRAVEFGDNKVH